MIIKKTLIKYILFFLSGIFSICSAQQQEPQELRGRVIHVHDGDTYTILVEGNKQVKVRMQGIDAPESGQDFSKKAKEYLRTLIIQKNVVVKYIEKDQYERILGETLLPDGREAGREMLKAGYAWHLKLYNSNEELAKLEKEIARLEDKILNLTIDEETYATDYQKLMGIYEEKKEAQEELDGLYRRWEELAE